MSSRFVLFKKDRCSYLFALIIFSLLLTSTFPVFAEDDFDEEDVFTLEAITVTAEKREAELQDVPMDISVVRPTEMDRLNINQMEDIGKALPDLNVSPMAGSFLTVTVRDVQQPLFNPSYETTVSTHLNGVQLTRVNGMENKFYDLARVEILKGPQGTLQGRGSTAGSMNIVTQKPDFDGIGGNIQLEYGNYNKKLVQGGINIPVTDKLAFRVAGRSLERNGYVDAGFSDVDSWSTRLTMLWEPTEKQSLSVVLDKDSSYNKGFLTTGTYYGVYGDLTIVPNPRYSDPEGDMYDPLIAPYAQGGEIESPWSVNWWLPQSESDNHWNDNKSWGISAQYDYDLDFATATVVFGHRALYEEKSYVVLISPSLSVPYIPFSWGVASNPGVQTEVYFSMVNGMIANAPNTIVATDMLTSGHYTSIEARLASNTTIAAGDDFEWIGGIMYMDDVVAESVQITENVFTETTTKETAVFGQLSWSPIDKLSITGGYRYTWDTKDYLGHNYGLGELIPGQFFQRLPTELDPADYASTTHKHEESTYKATVSYSFTDSIMSYIQYAKGYKTFNINRTGEKIDPEFMDAYEFGVKSRLLDNRLQVNLSSYYYKYKNYNNWYAVFNCAEGYEPTELNPGTCRSVAGAVEYDEYTNVPLSPGGTKQYGVNGNIMWLLTASDTFTASVSYSQNEYDNYDVAGAMQAVIPNSDSAQNPDYQVRNDDVEGIRPFNANFGYTKVFYIGTDTIMFNGNAFYKGETVDQVLHRNMPNQYSMSPDNAYWLFDASISYNSTRWVPEGVDWSLRFWCNNIFDSDELATRSFSDSTGVYTDATFTTPVEFAAESGIVTGTYVNPRTFGVTLGVNF